MLRILKTVLLMIAFLLLAAGFASFGQTLKPGPQVLTFFSDVDDTEQPYALYLPKNLKPTKRYPLVIMLHGAGSTAPPEGAVGFAPNALNFPVHFFQGSADTTVNPAGIREWAKRPGAEGPISKALAGRHIYVYGAGGNPSREELLARRTEAGRAADWSSTGTSARVLVFPRVVADSAVRPSDLASSNLVLFGTRETNSLIEKFSDRLPIRLNASASGYGLVYVFPAGEHYVLVSSGLPWWSGAGPTSPAAAPAARRRSSFMPGPAGALVGLQDYVLFKESLGNAIAAGRFDSNWRLTETDAAKLKASGVVTLLPE